MGLNASLPIMQPYINASLGILQNRKYILKIMDDILIDSSTHSCISNVEDLLKRYLRIA